jgi:hypothetical protein
VPSRHRGVIYKGELAKPIALKAHSAFWGPVVPKRVAEYQKKRARNERENAAKVERLFSKRLGLLFRHYGIENHNMSALALALAREHVPGFKVLPPETKPKRGRKPKWSPERLEKLYRTVQSVKQRLGLTDRQALKFIVNAATHVPVWGFPRDHKGSKEQWIETLEARLQDAKRLRKLHEQAERELESITASVKFRK